MIELLDVMLCIRCFGYSELIEHIRKAVITYFEELPASGCSKRVADICFAGTGRSLDHDMVVVAYVLAGSKSRDQAFVELIVLLY